MTTIGIIIWTAFGIVFLTSLGLTADTLIRRHTAKRVNTNINKLDKQ